MEIGSTGQSSWSFTITTSESAIENMQKEKRGVKGVLGESSRTEASLQTDKAVAQAEAGQILPFIAYFTTTYSLGY